VGPLVSLILGLGFGAVALVASSAGLEGLTLGVVRWLSVVNVVLAVFNLVPAAPLDGGRILRALLWRRHGDRVRAAVTAARSGRRFGLSLVMVGIVLVVFTGQLGGVWFTLIGWFISAAASAEEQQTQLQDSLRGTLVADVMTPDPVVPHRRGPTRRRDRSARGRAACHDPQRRRTAAGARRGPDRRDRDRHGPDPDARAGRAPATRWPRGRSGGGRRWTMRCGVSPRPAASGPRSGWSATGRGP
jgi:hypothetical protein